MKGKDIIITGLQSWDIPIGSNAIDIAKEMSRHNRVLYVNSPLDMMTIYRNKPTPETRHRMDVLKRKKEPLRQINENLWVLDFPFFIWSVNGIPDGIMFDAVNKRNNRKIFRYISRKANELGFSNAIHFIDNDIYRSYFAKEMLGAAITVYYRRDNLQPFPYWKKHVGRLEPRLIGKSDLVVCNSPQLASFARQFNANSFDVGQGVDLSAYDPALAFTEPEELQHIPHPRIGYIGDINSMRLDPDLIAAMAQARPMYSFVMIGGEDAVFKAHGLHQLPNVYFTGSVAKSRVPAFMAALDVCLNPQQVNEITMGNYPRKVDEYLAMGKPVVATRTGTMELFKDHVFLCNSAAEYVQAIEKALAENSSAVQEERIRFARSHSWENNVQAIYNHISEKLK